MQPNCKRLWLQQLSQQSLLRQNTPSCSPCAEVLIVVRLFTSLSVAHFASNKRSVKSSAVKSNGESCAIWTTCCRWSGLIAGGCPGPPRRTYPRRNFWSHFCTGITSTLNSLATARTVVCPSMIWRQWTVLSNAIEITNRNPNPNLHMMQYLTRDSNWKLFHISMSRCRLGDNKFHDNEFLRTGFEAWLVKNWRGSTSTVPP